jgi:hypothetical protein
VWHGSDSVAVPPASPAAQPPVVSHRRVAECDASLLQSFLETNREERFFCAVLLHVVLTPSPSQVRVLSVLGEAAGTRLDPDDVECYVEVAAWHALGDHKKWSQILYEARRDLLLALVRSPSACAYAGTVDEFEELLQANSLFWTGGPGTKLVSPGRWPLGAIGSVSTEVLGGAKNLRALKWAWNSKPDLLLLSRRAGVLIEAKAASGFGGNSQTGFDQQRVQQLIAELFPIVTQGLVDEPLRRITLTNKATQASVTWRELASLCSAAEIGPFAHAALARAAAVSD